MMTIVRTFFACLTAVLALPAWAVDLVPQVVAPGIYAFVGETGGRTYDNEAMNATTGFIVTTDGVVVVDSGSSFQVGRKIHDAIRSVTKQPVKWVINTGGQDHRWLGNGHFIAQGAEVIAHASGKADLLARGGDHLAALRPVLKEKLDGTVPTLPTRWLTGSDETLNLGGTTIEVKHRGGAHTPGDLMVWLPQQRVVFSGDIVYVDRMLGVIPVSHTGRWLASFAALEALKPARIVPGHGEVSDLPKAQAQTRDYLQALRTHMKRAVENGEDIGAAIKAFDAKPWMDLLNAAELHPGNASRTYLELERE